MQFSYIKKKPVIMKKGSYCILSKKSFFFFSIIFELSVWIEITAFVVHGHWDSCKVLTKKTNYYWKLKNCMWCWGILLWLITGLNVELTGPEISLGWVKLLSRISELFWIGVLSKNLFHSLCWLKAQVSFSDCPLSIHLSGCPFVCL
jgi:hypothetical protein